MNDLNKCSICGNSLHNNHYIIAEKMYRMEESFDYLLCNKCGTLQLKNPIEDFTRYYPRNYSGFYEGDKYTSILKKLRYRILGLFVLKGNLSFLTNKLLESEEFSSLLCLKGLNIKRNAKILDLGCGSGRWLEKLSDLGFKHLTGIDLYNERDINTNRWKFISGEIYDIKDCKFDIIVLHHSFEHMKEPLAVLKKINELLNESGVCIIRIPVMEKYAWRRYKTNWVQIDAPRHLFLYTEKAIKHLGKKAGLKLKKVIYDSNEFQFWGSEIYEHKKISLVTSLRIINTIFPKKVFEQYKEKAKFLNKNRDGDQAIFYFKKN